MRARLQRVLRHPVAINALALYASQFAISIVPLVILPFLARTLGPTEMGTIVFVQSFSFTLGVVLEYGFGYSASRDVAQRREDPDGLARTVAGVLGAQLILGGLCVLVALALWPLVPAFRERPELLGLGIVLLLTQGLAPVWYFVGVERMVSTALLEFVTRAAGAVAIIVLVDAPGDGPVVLIAYAVAQALSTAWLFAAMYRRVTWRLPSVSLARDALARGWTLFISNAALVAYGAANTFLLGLMVAPAQVAFFASADKIVRAGGRVVTGAAAAAYPRVAALVGAGHPQRANRLALIALAALLSGGLVAALGLVVLAGPAVDLLFGPAFAETVPLLRILALWLPVAILGSTLSGLWLLPRGHDRPVTRVIIFAGALNIGLLVALTPVFGVRAAAWSLVGVEALVAVSMAALLLRSGILGAAPDPPEATTAPPPSAPTRTESEHADVGAAR